MLKRLLLFLLVLVTACGDGKDKTRQPAGVPDELPQNTSEAPRRPKPKPRPPALEVPTYAADDILRLNEIQMKGSHNSYHVAADEPNAPEWTQYTLPPLREQLTFHGVRQFELDVHYYKNHFQVFHLPDLDQRTTCLQFTDCLQEMYDWSVENPGHQPIIVWLELKDEWDPEKIAPHVEQLDEEVLSVIPRDKIIAPDDVRRGYPTLSEAIAEAGWPTLGETRGRFMFVIMNEGEARYRYTYEGQSLDGRLMFVTFQGWSYGVIAMIDDVPNQESNIYTAAQQGMLVRSRVDDLPGRGGNYAQNLEIALRAGAHMIATDYPAANAIPGYNVAMPGGAPSRCNPITAREFCKPLLIENPALLRGN